MNTPAKTAIVRYRDTTESLPCPYGDVTRIMTGGDGGIANVHVVRVTDGSTHYHTGYDEIYYVLSGTGSAFIEKEEFLLKPGAVLNVPTGMNHSITADDELEFIIFGTPAMSADDDRFTPRSS